jgi:hypothetical protein
LQPHHNYPITSNATSNHPWWHSAENNGLDAPCWLLLPINKYQPMILNPRTHNPNLFPFMNGNPNTMHLNFSHSMIPNTRTHNPNQKPLDMGIVEHMNIRPCHPFYFSSARSRKHKTWLLHSISTTHIQMNPYTTKNNYGYNVLL